MQNLSLSELRDLYPSIKATSKKRFLELVAEQEEVIAEEVVIEVPKLNSDELTWYNIVEYIVGESKGNKKILIKTESSFDADFLFQHLKEKLFPVLEESGTMLMASSSRRDMHINGTLYVRLVCQANYDHIKRLIAYNTFKSVVN
jgi:hypothetical protein|tara:strand:+ start:838 stop:1272 length:435 start_codon:yes stop_codon:yes gene_type:complete